VPRLKLKLEDLRVESFETTRATDGVPGAGRSPECGECTACTEYTGCADCTACTRCTWPTCIHTADDGGGCQPGTVP
jgi:hypothetical protein